MIENDATSKEAELIFKAWLGQLVGHDIGASVYAATQLLACCIARYAEGDPEELEVLLEGIGPNLESFANGFFETPDPTNPIVPE